MVHFLHYLSTVIQMRAFSTLGRYARGLDHLAVRDVAQGAPLGGGSTLHLHITIYLPLD